MKKIRFDDGWEFTDQPRGFLNPNAGYQPVTLPHDISITKPRNKNHPTGGGGGFAWSGVVTYRKKLHVPAEWQGQSVQLEFEGVYMNAEVSVNENIAAFHPYGYTSFLADLTPYLTYGSENTISVVVNNSAQPNSRWYSGTGIYRHVWLRLGGGVHIRPWGVFVTTPQVSEAASSVAVAVDLANRAEAEAAVSLRSTVRDLSGRQLARVETPVRLAAGSNAQASQSLRVEGVKLWSVDEPNLYRLVCEVVAGERVIDSEETTFGFRTFSVDAVNGFRLNGVPLKLKGGCVHHDNGLLGSASYDRAEERKIELMKSAGYNAIRCAHNPPAPAMLDACDRLGMLVIDETFDCWRMGKNSNDYHLYFEDWWQRDTQSMVLRDRNHPSIILWSIGNEVSERTGVSDGYAWCQRQADFVRSLDPTRLVTSAVPFLFESIPAPSGEQPAAPPDEDMINQFFDTLLTAPANPADDRWGNLTRPFFQHLDVGGYNYLHKRYATDGERFAGRVIAGTETWPHQAYDSWEETRRLPHVIGDFVWTSLDYLGESGIGMVTYDKAGGSFINQDVWPYHLANCGDFDICGFKRPQSYFRDILWGVRAQPFIGVLDPQDHGKKIRFNHWGWEPVIDSWTFPGSEGRPTQVDVYSAAEEVELRLNGAPLDRKPLVKNKATFEVTYTPGTLEAVAFSKGQEAGRAALKTASAPAALRLTADRTALKAEFGDLAYVTVEVVDRDGAVVKHAAPEVSASVSGAGDLLAFGAANPLTEELYTADRRKAFQGRLMAVVRANGQAGEIRLQVSAEGLKGAELSLQTD